MSSELSVHWVAQFWQPDDLVADKRKLKKSADRPIAANERPRDRYQGGLTFSKGVALDITHSLEGEARDLSVTNLKNTTDLTTWIETLRSAAVDPLEGTYTLTLTPSADELSTGPAGPTLGSNATSAKTTSYDAQWRPLTINFTLDENFRLLEPIVQTDPTVVVPKEAPRRGKHGYAYVSTTSKGAQVLEIDWKPDWLRRIRSNHPMKQSGSRTGPTIATVHPAGQNRGGQSIEAIVLHNTSGSRKEDRKYPLIGPALNQFTKPWKTTKFKINSSGNKIPVIDPTTGKQKKDAKKRLVFEKIGKDSRGNDKTGYLLKKKVGESGRGIEDTTGIHYVVDADGHVVKMLHEDQFAFHAHTAKWLDITASDRINKRSVGIEHVLFKTNPEHPVAQFRASVDLVSEIQTAFSISPRCLAGHGDVMTDGSRLDSGDRRLCPGFHFPWGEFEKKGLALAANDAFQPAESMYGGLFELNPAASIAFVKDNKQKDSDLDYGGKKFWAASFVHASDESVKVPLPRALEVDGAPGTYVDRDHPTIALKRIDTPPSPEIAKKRLGPITAPVIRQLQDDLRRIGWPISANGVYDEPTRDAVRRFQGRFILAGTPGTTEPSNKFTKDIALRIKQVIATLRDDSDTRLFAG